MRDLILNHSPMADQMICRPSASGEARLPRLSMLVTMVILFRCLIAMLIFRGRRRTASCSAAANSGRAALGSPGLLTVAYRLRARGEFAGWFRLPRQCEITFREAMPILCARRDYRQRSLSSAGRSGSRRRFWSLSARRRLHGTRPHAPIAADAHAGFMAFASFLLPGY